MRTFGAKSGVCFSHIDLINHIDLIDLIDLTDHIHLIDHIKSISHIIHLYIYPADEQFPEFLR
jgi:hypothetical protein